jgi:hypothetical protein
MCCVVSAIAKLDEEQIQAPDLGDDMLERVVRARRIRLEELLCEQDSSFDRRDRLAQLAYH